MVNNFCFDGWDQEESLFEDDILSFKMNPLMDPNHQNRKKREDKKTKNTVEFCLFPFSFVFMILRSKTAYAFLALESLIQVHRNI